MCCDDAPDSKPSYMVWVSVMMAIYLCPFVGKVDAIALRLANALTDDRMMDVLHRGLVIKASSTRMRTVWSFLTAPG